MASDVNVWPICLDSSQRFVTSDELVNAALAARHDGSSKTAQENAQIYTTIEKAIGGKMWGSGNRHAQTFLKRMLVTLRGTG